MKRHVIYMTCTFKTFTTEGCIISARYSNKYIKKDSPGQKICQTSAEARFPEDQPPATSTLSWSFCLDIVVGLFFCSWGKVIKLINYIHVINYIRQIFFAVTQVLDWSNWYNHDWTVPLPGPPLLSKCLRI